MKADFANASVTAESDDRLAGPTCVDIRDDLPWLKERYATLVLISHAEHLKQFDATDQSKIIVCCDWLLWQRCVREKRHCVHWDLGLLDWDARDEAVDHFLGCNDWVYVDGVDATMFCGVSLGRKLVRQISVATMDYERLSRSLRWHVQRFRPSEIVYYAYHTDFDFLGPTEGFHIADEIGRDMGIKVTDRTEAVLATGTDAGVTFDYRSDGTHVSTFGDRLRALALRAFCASLSGLSVARRRLWGNTPTVMMAMSALTSTPVLKKFKKGDVQPIFLARWVPNKKNLLSILKQLWRGILFVDVPDCSLTRVERNDIDQIERRILAAWQGEAIGREAMVRRVVQDRIFATGQLHNVARDVKWVQRLLDRYRPSMFLTDGLQNRLSTIFVELCAQLKTKTAVTWHGPYLQDIKFDVLGCDPRTSSSADFCFSWGKLTDDWLAATSATTKSIRTGSPVGSLSMPKNISGGRYSRALLLQYLMPYHDLATPLAHEYFYFVECVRALRRAGVDQIRMRLHPGVAKTSYYRQIADEFDLECEISGEGPFSEQVEWADFVIGPIASGAALEVMAFGRPCYPVLLPPHCITMGYFEGKTLFEDITSLAQALQTGSAADPVPYLRDFASGGEIEDPAEKIWQTIGRIAGDDANQVTMAH